MHKMFVDKYLCVLTFVSDLSHKKFPIPKPWYIKRKNVATGLLRGRGMAIVKIVLVLMPCYFIIQRGQEDCFLTSSVC